MGDALASFYALVHHPLTVVCDVYGCAHDVHDGGPKVGFGSHQVWMVLLQLEFNAMASFLQKLLPHPLIPSLSFWDLLSNPLISSLSFWYFLLEFLKEDRIMVHLIYYQVSSLGWSCFQQSMGVH
jgi:hypothetical protein